MNARISKWSLLVAAGAAVGLGGCQSGEVADAGPEFSSGLTALLEGETAPAVDAETIDDLLAEAHEPDDIDALIRSSYETLKRAFLEAEPEVAQADEPAVAEVPEIAEATSETMAVEEEVLATGFDAGAGLEVLMSQAAPATPAPTNPLMLIQAAAEDLADAILGQLPYSMDPVEDAVTLVGLEPLVPGVTELALETGTLTGDERSVVESALRLSDAVRSMGSDPDAAADAAQRISMDMAETRPIRITRAELCTRVDGYGQYTPFAVARFVAGKRHRVIVYVEVDRLGHALETPATGETAPRYAVELTQRIEIYHKADDVLAMATPTLKDRRVGRNRFRDYYLVTAVDLPETLSVGEYRIKVTMRDGSDDAVAQAVVPVTIVADASALQDTP